MSDELTLTPSKPSDSTSVTVEMSEFGVHSEAVLSWRVKEFTRMGFAEFVADFLASTRIDLHQMDALLQSGCAHELAAQILMGTMWSGDDDQWRFTDEASYLEEHNDRELINDGA